MSKVEYLKLNMRICYMNVDPFYFMLISYGNTLTVSPDTYSFPLQPRIDSVSGCTDSGNATIDCDTRGSVVITIKVWIRTVCPDFYGYVCLFVPANVLFTLFMFKCCIMNVV